MRFSPLLAISPLLSLSCFSSSPALAVDPPPPIRLEQGVAVGPVVRGARRPFVADPVQYAIVRGTMKDPVVGDSVRLPNGTEQNYVAVTAKNDGWMESPALEGGGYLFTTVDSPEERIVLLAAQGHNLVYVNGELFPGDPYRTGALRLPIQLHKGVNRFLFAVGRGGVRAELLPVTAPFALNTDDTTLPDLLTGNTDAPLWAALPILNASAEPGKALALRATIGTTSITTALPTLPPLTATKTGFRLPHPTGLTPGETKATLSLRDGEREIATATVTVRVRKTGETYRQTFVSGIDGSVQYFGVNPAQKPDRHNALVLSLHGASVEAQGQADAYGPKDWATLAAPTNRRPFGFDWEDWGRLDALEVLAVAQKRFPHDPARVVLTGHSMGGHGSWSLGSLFPDHFAAVGPSAGWISFTTYGGSPRPPRKSGETVAPAVALLERAANLYDTLDFGTNLLQEKVYVLHGDADTNVPVAQARQMRAQLEAWHHPSVAWHEQPSADHWWDLSDAPGADCVDWKPMFDLFQSARLPGRDSETPFTFTTVAPGVSATCRWIGIDQQERMLLPSIVRCACGGDTATVTTENVARLTLLPERMPGGGRMLRQLALDGQTLPVEAGSRGPIYLRREAGSGWRIAGRPGDGEKRAGRSGPFKQAFTHRFVLVYPTGGSAPENAWGYARARFDTETFLYRGNGSPEMVADRDYDFKAMRDRDVILYGNAAINTVWKRLLKDCPVVVEPGKIRVGGETRAGEDIATAFVYPKSGSAMALVGAVGGTGGTGLRLTDRLPYFTSGAAFPDILIADPNVLLQGGDAVLGAGYFGNDWRLGSGEFSWR